MCIIWGDRDHQAPPPVLDAYREAASRMKNVEVHVFPGVQHAYMFKEDMERYDQKTREFTMKRTLEILAGLRGAPEAQMRKAS